MTCEGKDGAIRPASRQEVGHVAAPGVDKDCGGPQVVSHSGCTCAQLLAHPAIGIGSQRWKHDLPILLLPAQTAPDNPGVTAPCTGSHRHLPG